MRTTHIKKTVAMSGAMFLALMGATAPADASAPHQGQGHHAKTTKTEKTNNGHAKATAGHATSHGNSAASHGSSGASQGASSGTHGNSSGTHGAQGGSQGGQGGSQGGGKGGDPAGNNGTVKVDDDPWLGPNGHGGSNPGNGVGNDPHLGCDFQVEWYGFDQGDDIISTVTFEMQSPTKDVVLGGYTPTQVFVGGDAAGGGTDLDGKQSYHLSFDGAPHPKHGYHVKLTINTPGSIGADVKHKVFWVEGCAGTTPPETPGTPETPPEVVGEQGHGPHSHTHGSDVEVKGEQATVSKGVPAAVPTTVESGLVPSTSATATSAGSGEGPLAAGLLGLCLLGAGLLTRRARS